MSVRLHTSVMKMQKKRWHSGLIDFYNNGRLHGALLYLTPEDYFAGIKEVRLAERKEKLHTADINRKAYWLQQQQA